MDTQLSLQLQQAWILAQLNRQSSSSPQPAPKIEPFPSSPSPLNSHSFDSSLDSASPSLFPGDPEPWLDLSSWRSVSSDSWNLPAALPVSMVSTDGAVVSASPWTPSSVSGPSNSGASFLGAADSWASLESQGSAAPGMSSVEDDVLMDPCLDYISDMLMDEQMEDRKCMQQECVAYQAIVNGFYEILGEESSSHSSCTDRNFSLEANESVKDYSWIDDVLVADPRSIEQTPASALSPPWSCESTITGRSEPDVKFQPFDSSSGGSSFSRDSPAFAAVLHDTASWNGGFSPEAASVPVQAYNSSILSDVADSNFPALQNIIYQDDILPRVDSGAGSNFHPELPPQTSNRNLAKDDKFMRVKSESLQYNTGQDQLQMNGFAAGDSGGYRRSISEKVPELIRQSQEGQMFRSIDHSGSKSSHGRLSGGHVLQTRDVVEAQVKKGHRSDDIPSDMNGRGNTLILSSDDKLSFVKNEDLNAENNAKILGEWSPADLDKKYRWKKMGAYSNGTSGKRTGIPDAVDLRGLLVSCAQAVAGNDLRKANEMLQEIRQHSSPTGSAAQRLAHYFAEGLMARLSGTGARLYTAMANNRPSAAKMLKAVRLTMELCPYFKLSHYFANKSILKAVEGASRLHIVDYGITYGLQWPILISALADRKEGPPFLRITGIEFPQPGVNPAERVEETGRRLSEYARTYNVPFEFKAIASKWEDVEPSSMNLRKGEFLVVNCVHRLRHLLDETVVSSSPRKKVLSRMRSMNPDLLLIAVMNAGFSAPFFVSRFREALYHFSSKFDMIDTVVGCDVPERLMIEGEIMGRDILNVVACEGPERVERPETFRQWQARFKRAGFELLPLIPSLVSKARAVVKAFYHKDFGVDDDSKWMLLGWKGRIVESLSAWKPSSGGAPKD